jgi:hypothetical protein
LAALQAVAAVPHDSGGLGQRRSQMTTSLDENC